MATYVIVPRSAAECNQLASIVHSKGFSTPSWAVTTPIRVGVPMVCFSALGVYIAEARDTPNMIDPVYLQANQLYNVLVDSEIIL